MPEYTTKPPMTHLAPTSTATATAAPGKRTQVEQSYGSSELVERRAADNGDPGPQSEEAGEPARTGVVSRNSTVAELFGRSDVHRAVATAAVSSSEPLSEVARPALERSFGTDLSGVRVHTGSESAHAAQSVGAKAYTVGQDIHFAAGRHDPAGNAGQHLLAHEVAHTVQQRGSSPVHQNRLEISRPQDGAEHEADMAADAVVRGEPVSAIRQAPAHVAREHDDVTPSGYPAPAGPYAPPNPPAPQVPQAPQKEAPAPDPQQTAPLAPAKPGSKAGTNGMFPDSSPTPAIRKWNYVVYADHVRLGNRAVDDSKSGVVIGTWPWLLNNPGDLTGDLQPRKEDPQNPDSAYRQDERVWGEPTSRGPDPSHMTPLKDSSGLSQGNAAIPGTAARHDLAIFDTRSRGRGALKEWIQKYYASVTLAESIKLHLGPASSHVKGVDDPDAYPKRMQQYLNETGGGKYPTNYVYVTKCSDISEDQWDGVIDAFGYAEGYYSRRQDPGSPGKPGKVAYVENKGIIYRKTGRDPIDVDPAFKSLARVKDMPEATPPEIMALLGG